MDEKKKLIIILLITGGSFILLIAIISIIYITIFQTKNNNTTLDKYTDPGSGEVIYSGKNKATEKETVQEKDEIIYLGLNELLDIGMSKTQLAKIKSFFVYYKNNKDPNLKEISVTTSSIKHNITRNSNGDIDKDIATFAITINRKDQFNIEADYSGINSIIIKLLNNDKTQLILSSDNIPRG